MIEINKNSLILFLGVGGVSMFQIALAFKGLGYAVLGYDETESERTKHLQDEGIKIFTKFNKEMFSARVCIKTAAIKDNSKIVKTLKQQNCKIIDRAEALNFLASKFPCVIAVAGTHGKTTTATLIYEMLKAGNKKVSCHIGADIVDARFNMSDEFLVVEACEYNKSFLRLRPNISVVTNVEAEHLDSYGNLFHLRNAFITFLKMGKQRFAYKEKSTRFLRRVRKTTFVENTTFKFEPKLKGEYNKKNIALAVAVAKSLGVDDAVITTCVDNFSGVPRRYEHIGKIGKAEAFIDYAHHPTEVKAFMEMFAVEHKNPLIVFQPHTYSRTKNFLKEFVGIFKQCRVVIYKEYPAREARCMGLSARDLFEAVKIAGGNVKYVASAKQLTKQIYDCDSVAFVGAGDIDQVAKMLTKQES